MESIERHALDNILKEEKLLTVNKFLDILSTLDKLGLLDVIQGAINDEELMTKLFSGILNDKALSLLINYKNLGELADLVLNEKTQDKLKFLLELAGTLQHSGVVEPLLGMLKDEDVMGRIISALINDKTLELMQNWENLLNITLMLTKRETSESLEYFLSFLNELRTSGILDPIRGLLKDEETLGKIISALVNDFTLGLVSNWSDIAKHLSSLDLTGFKGYVDIINAAGKAINDVNYKPIRSVFDILRSLKDPDIQNGLGFLFSVIKELGKMAKEKNAPH